MACRADRRLIPLATLLGCALVCSLAAPLAAQPDASPEPMRAALAALDRGDGIAAEAELERVLAAGAARPQVAAAMGEALLDQGDARQARQWLGPAIFAPESRAWGLRMLARLERLEGNLPAAGRALDRALAAAPRDPLAWVEIGRLRYAGGEQVQAIEASLRALEAGPNNIRVLEFRAQLLRDAQGWAAALPLYARAREIAPDDLSVLGGYAACLGEGGRAVEMLAVTRHMIDLAPRHPLAWYLQSVLAARAGNVPLARSLLARAGTRLRDEPAGMLLAGILELEAGNAAVAAGHLERLAERQAANPRAQMLLARALYEAGDHEELLARFSSLAARPDAPTYLLILLGRAHEERGDRAAAAVLLDRASAATIPPLEPMAEPDPPGVLAARFADDPGAAGAAVAYVRVLLGAGNFAGASQAAGQFLKLHPGSADALGLAGDAALASGRADVAITRYIASAQVRYPDHLLLRMSEAFARSGRARIAGPYASRYLAGWPASRLAGRLAAGFAAADGDWPRARAMLESLRQRGGNRDVRLLADLSLAQLRSGDEAAALESSERAYALAPSSGVAAQARGMALAQMDRDPDLARQLLDKARAIGGDNPLLVQARRKLAGS